MKSKEKIEQILADEIFVADGKVLEECRTMNTLIAELNGGTIIGFAKKVLTDSEKIQILNRHVEVIGAISALNALRSLEQKIKT